MCKGVLFWSRESREKGWLGLEEPSKEKEKHIGTERSRKRKRERGGERKGNDGLFAVSGP